MMLLNRRTKLERSKLIGGAEVAEVREVEEEAGEDLGVVEVVVEAEVSRIFKVDEDHTTRIRSHASIRDLRCIFP